MLKQPGPAFRFCVTLSSVLVLLSTGCGEQPQIKTYEIAKSPGNLGPEISEPGESKMEPARMLAAMIPRGEKSWFFKVVGPPQEVGKQADRVRKLIASVEFPKPNEPTWTLPEGWTTTGPDGEFRYDTIKIPGDGAPLEMSVISLGGNQSLLANINRWRREVNLAEIGQAEVNDQIEKLKTKDDEALFFDFLGTKAAGGGGPMSGRAPFLEAMRKRQEEAQREAARQQAPSPPPAYSVPEGWVKARTVPSPFSPVIETYEVKQGGKEAKVTVSRMVSQAGLWLANINRWRVQELNMKPIDEKELEAAFSPIKAGTTDGRYLKLEGETQATLVGIFDLAGSSWFFKMIGDADFVIEKEAEFKTFVQSVRFSSEEAGDE